MSQVQVSYSDFTTRFPEFSNKTQYPEPLITSYIDEAEQYISTQNFRIAPSNRILAIEYMIAHLIALSNIDAAGTVQGQQSGNITTSATVDGVSRSILAPIADNSFAQWIQSTPYGKKYWALMTANNATPIFFPGTPRAFGIR